MREQCYTYKAIGEAVGVHPRTIAHWAQVAEHKGEKAVIAGGQRGVRQGDRRSLSSSQEVLIRTLMTDKMPDQLKLGFALWTRDAVRSEEHTSELQSLMRISYAVFCLKKKKNTQNKR